MNEIVDNTHLHKSGSWDLIWNMKAPLMIKKISCGVCVGAVFPLEHGVIVDLSK